LEWDLLAGLMPHLILTPTLACLIPYGRGGVAEVEAEDVVIAGAVFGLIGIDGGNRTT
jgi:hypothetical protein